METVEKVVVEWKEDVGFWKATLTYSEAIHLTQVRYLASDEDIRKEILGRINQDKAEIVILRPSIMVDEKKPEN